MRQRGVTLSLIWEEYRAAHPDVGYGYSRFCDLYRRWEGRLSPTMRQHHVAGERVFVDYAIVPGRVTAGCMSLPRTICRSVRKL